MKIHFTLVLDEAQLRAIAHHYGNDRPAYAAEVRNWGIGQLRATLDVLQAEKEESDATAQPDHAGE